MKVNIEELGLCFRDWCNVEDNFPGVWEFTNSNAIIEEIGANTLGIH